MGRDNGFIYPAKFSKDIFIVIHTKILTFRSLKAHLLTLLLYANIFTIMLKLFNFLGQGSSLWNVFLNFVLLK